MNLNFNAKFLLNNLLPNSSHLNNDAMTEEEKICQLINPIKNKIIEIMQAKEPISLISCILEIFYDKRKAILSKEEIITGIKNKMEKNSLILLKEEIIYDINLGNYINYINQVLKSYEYFGLLNIQDKEYIQIILKNIKKNIENILKELSIQNNILANKPGISLELNEDKKNAFEEKCQINKIFNKIHNNRIIINGKNNISDNLGTNLVNHKPSFFLSKNNKFKGINLGKKTFISKKDKKLYNVSDNVKQNSINKLNEKKIKWKTVIINNENENNNKNDNENINKNNNGIGIIKENKNIIANQNLSIKNKKNKNIKSCKKFVVKKRKFLTNNTFIIPGSFNNEDYFNENSNNHNNSNINNNSFSNLSIENLYFSCIPRKKEIYLLEKIMNFISYKNKNLISVFGGENIKQREEKKIRELKQEISQNNLEIKFREYILQCWENANYNMDKEKKNANLLEKINEDIQNDFKIINQEIEILKASQFIIKKRNKKDNSLNHDDTGIINYFIYNFNNCIELLKKIKNNKIRYMSCIKNIIEFVKNVNKVDLIMKDINEPKDNKIYIYKEEINTITKVIEYFGIFEDLIKKNIYSCLVNTPFEEQLKDQNREEDLILIKKF